MWPTAVSTAVMPAIPIARAMPGGAAAISNVSILGGNNNVQALNDALNGIAVPVQVVCLNDALNQNDVRILQDILNQSPILNNNLNNSLNNNEILNNLLQNAASRC